MPTITTAIRGSPATCRPSSSITSSTISVRNDTIDQVDTGRGLKSVNRESISWATTPLSAAETRDKQGGLNPPIRLRLQGDEAAVLRKGDLLAGPTLDAPSKNLKLLVGPYGTGTGEWRWDVAAKPAIEPANCASRTPAARRPSSPGPAPCGPRAMRWRRSRGRLSIENSSSRSSTGGVGGYSDYAAGAPPLDTDQDGMPDDWSMLTSSIRRQFNANARDLSQRSTTWKCISTACSVRSAHERHLHHRKLPAANTIARWSCIIATPAICRSSTTTAICRPPQIAEDRRFENLTQIWLARRSLQVAGDADGRRAGTLLHRRRLGLGEVPEVGRDRAADAPQSAVPLDAPGAEAAAWASATGCWAPTRPRAFGTSATPSSPEPEFSAAASCGR